MAKGISIHIGVNSVSPAHYAGWSGPLEACEADAEDLARLAAGIGYETHLIKTAEATRDAVVAQLQAAVSSLVEGDILLVTYSGHGGQLPDRNGDEIDDMMDETWCLFDGELIDDELHVLYAQLAKGVRAFVLSDSCHSGTVTRMAAASGGEGYDLARVELRAEGRGAGPRYRAAPPEVLRRTYRQNRDFYDDLAEAIPIVPEPQAAVRLISGCQDNQLSLDGTFNGLFTGTLLRVWNEGRFEGNYKQFHRAIMRRMPSDQTPNHFVMGPRDLAFDGQRPFAIE